MKKKNVEQVFLHEILVLHIILLILCQTELIKHQQINKCLHYQSKLTKTNTNKDNQLCIKMMSKPLIKCLTKVFEWQISFSRMMKMRIFTNIKPLKDFNQIEVILMYSALEKTLIQITLEQLLLLVPQSNFQIHHRLTENQTE